MTKSRRQWQQTTVLVGAHFPPEVRSALFLLQADTGESLRELLGEAINDLCVKYGKPKPFKEGK